MLEGDQVTRRELTAGTGQLVGMMDLKQFCQTFVGIKTHPVPIGDGYEHEVEKLFQPGQSQVESLPEESMIDPTERTLDRSNAIRARRLWSFAHHGVKLRPNDGAVHLGLCDLHVQFSAKLCLGKQLHEYHGLCDLHG
jgi:hypothetical protein